MSNYPAGSDPNERLSRHYAQPRQEPRTPANIIRRPLMLPGHGLPMERVQEEPGKFARGGRVEGDGPVPALLDNGYVIPPSGMDRLRDAVLAQAGDDDVAVSQEPEEAGSSPFCMACGLEVEFGIEVCPECGGDVYDPSAAG